MTDGIIQEVFKHRKYLNPQYQFEYEYNRQLKQIELELIEKIKQEFKNNIADMFTYDATLELILENLIGDNQE